MKEATWSKYTIIGVITAIIASLCCVGPLLLLSLGLGGAWISTLTQFDFLRPIGIVITIIFLVLAFWKIHITPKKCSTDKPCATPRALHVQRAIFWIVTLLLVLLLTFPWYAFLFY